MSKAGSQAVWKHLVPEEDLRLPPDVGVVFMIRHPVVWTLPLAENSYSLYPMIQGEVVKKLKKRGDALDWFCGSQVALENAETGTSQTFSSTGGQEPGKPQGALRPHYMYGNPVEYTSCMIWYSMFLGSMVVLVYMRSCWVRIIDSRSPVGITK